MNVLHIVGGLPHKDNSFFQPFVQHQIDSLGKEGINISILNIHGYKSFLNYFLIAGELKKIIKEKKINLIHAHYSYSVIPTLFLGKDIPIVLSLMGSDLLGSPDQKGNMTLRGVFDKKFTQLILRKVDYIIVKSEKMRYHVKNKVPIDVIPNGINFDLFKQMDQNLARKKLNLNQDEFLILFLGNPNNHVKNFNLAKNSFDIFHSNYSDTKLLAPFGITSEEVVTYMNACDVLLFTSFWEGSPNVVKEAMACNLPIISTDVGDVNNIINGTSNCYIVNFTEEDIVDKLSTIYNNSKRSNGRNMVQHLSDDLISKKIVKIYEKVVNMEINNKI